MCCGTNTENDPKWLAHLKFCLSSRTKLAKSLSLAFDDNSYESHFHKTIKLIKIIAAQWIGMH